MNFFHLTVGGVELTVELADGVKLVEEDALYRPFLAYPCEHPVSLKVPVRLSLDPGPPTAELPLLFDTGGSWSAYQYDNGVLLELQLQQSGTHLWKAVLDPQLPSVSIYCGRRLVRPGPTEVTVSNPLHYPLDQLLLTYLLTPRQGLVLHAAGIHLHQQGIVLAGRSGAGKTTVMRQLDQRFSGLSDDRVIVRNHDSIPHVYGTPWAGEGRVASAEFARLRAVLLLHQASEPRLVPLTASDAIRQLLPTASILWYDRQRMAMALDFVESLLTQVPAYELHFRPDPTVIDLIAELVPVAKTSSANRH
jgi:hypothetical protein